jgi:hypothetical protein
MRRQGVIDDAGVALSVVAFLALAAPACAQANLVVGEWRAPAPGGVGIEDFILSPDGRAIWRQPGPGFVITAFGRYALAGNSIRMVWDQITPDHYCAPGPMGQVCQRTVALPLNFTFAFESPNVWVWVGNPSVRLQRVAGAPGPATPAPGMPMSPGGAPAK